MSAIMLMVSAIINLLKFNPTILLYNNLMWDHNFLLIQKTSINLPKELSISNQIIKRTTFISYVRYWRPPLSICWSSMISLNIDVC